MGRDIRVGAFRGPLLPDGTLRMQMRIEKGSMFGPDVSYTGQLEISGGRVKRDLGEALTLPVLLAESAREVREELGIEVGDPVDPLIFRMVFVSPDGWEDWAFVIPTPPECWDANVKMSRRTVDVNPDQLKVLGELDLVLSGIGKRMWRMSQASFMRSNKEAFKDRAQHWLYEYKPDWRTELLSNPEEALAGFRRELNL